MKRVGFICFFFIGILLIAFHQAFLLQIASWTLQTYTKSKWGHALQYDSLLYQEGKLMISNPHFEDSSLFQADQAIIGFSFNLKNRLINFQMELVKPKVHFKILKAPGWEKGKSLLVRKPKWFKNHFQLDVSDGKLVLPFHEPVRFDLKADSQKGADILFHFDADRSLSNQFHIVTAVASDQMEMKCSFHQTHCGTLLQFGEFFGLPFPKWKTISGNLDGDLTIVFPRAHKPYVKGDLNIDQFRFELLEIPLSGKLELARLKMGVEGESPPMTGLFEILKPSVLHYHEGENPWALDHIQGGIKLNGLETALISLEAVANKGESSSNWDLQGSVDFRIRRLLNFDLELHCFSPLSTKGKIKLAMLQPLKEKKLTKVEVHNLSWIDLECVQTILSTLWPALSEVKFKNGIFDALLEAEVEQGKGEIWLKEFKASQISTMLKQWDGVCHFDLLQGYGKAAIGQGNFWNTLQAGLHLENGRLDLESLIPKLPLTDIQGHLLIQNGDIKNSLITLQLGSLKGKMDFDWGEQKQLLTFRLDGQAKDLADFFPQRMQEPIKIHFDQQRLLILANIKNLNKQIELGGTLHIQEENESLETIHFGCEFIPGEDKGQKLSPSGWFYAHSLPLEKYLSPFLFRDGLLHMEGDGEFRGLFDDQLLTIKYDADHLKVENEDLKIEIEGMHASIPGQLAGLHQIDLNTLDHWGIFPIQHGIYEEKNNGLIFEDIQGKVDLKPGKMKISSLEALCHQVYFSGELELDYSDPTPGVFKLNIQCPVLSGKVSHIQRLLSHLQPSSLLHQFPLEGEVSSRESGLFLNFAFKPHEYDLQAHLMGSIGEGAIGIEGTDIGLKGIYMDVEYIHGEKKLEFSDIQGTCLVGKPLRVEEYQFLGRHITLDQIQDPQLSLDITIKDQEEEIFRFAGHSEEENGKKKFIIDPQLTHLSSIYPQSWECSLRDWNHVDHFKFDSTFDLKTFFQDFSRFKKSGFLSFSPELIEKLSLMNPIEGKGSLSIKTQPDQSYSFQFASDEFKKKGGDRHSLLFIGEKRDKKWIIDHFQWDDWNIYAEVVQVEEKWKIPFLGMSLGDDLLMGMEGDFIPAEGLLQGSLKYCEVNIASLNQWKIFPTWLSQWNPKGHLKMKGDFEWSSHLASPWNGFKASLAGEIENFSFKDNLLSLTRHFTLEVGEDKGIVLYFPELKMENRFLGNQELSQLELKIDRKKATYSAMTQQERYPFQIEGSIHLPDCCLGDASLLSKDGKEKLHVLWEREEKSGLIIKAIQGKFAGSEMDLTEDRESEWRALKGDMKINFNKLASLFPTSIGDTINQLKLKAPYSFTGNFWMDPNLGNKLLEILYFKGKLNAQEPIFKGYQVQNIQADVQYVPGRLDIHNLIFQDSAGVMKVPSFIAMLDPKQQLWTLFMPHLSVRNLRIALLRDTEGGKKISPRSKFQNLIVKRIDIRDFYGELGRQESWKANGNLHFSNPARKNILHPLFVIPGEIILRLGLDPNVLNPVTGTISFLLNGDKFYLQKLKDVYSEGRGSKFYLAEGLSWMDLQGNLSVQIRMKQYNLIFKIAELFKVSVTGNLRKPVYTLQKQPRPAAKKNLLHREKLY